MQLTTAAVLLGMKEGDDKIRSYITNMPTINGWKVGSLFGDRTFFNGEAAEATILPLSPRRPWQ
jgi:hypothetical protein